MIDHIPSQSAMIELLGQSLFEVWQKLCLVIDEKYEILAVRTGLTSINIVEVAKHFVLCMLKVIAWVS